MSVRSIEAPVGTAGSLLRLGGRDVWLGALLFALLALAFLSKPIARIGDGVYSPADISQAYTLTRVPGAHRPGNDLLSDVCVQMQPWAMFQRDELRAGRIPLWNPWNGNGVPHLANYQAAVFSPFTVPYYVMPFRVAAIAAAFLKLWCLGFFTFLFLRELRLNVLAAAFGGIVFAYAGHNLVLIGHPHSGVSALLPPLLFVVERIARVFEHDARQGHVCGAAWKPAHAGLIVALTALLVLAQFAGHPETLFFSLAFVAIFAIVRAIGLFRDLGAIDGARRSLAALSVQLAFAGLVAAGIGALQTVPFFEYLRDSAMLVDRTGKQVPLGIFAWPTLVFPNLLGSPSNVYFLSGSLPRPDYTIATMAYVGAVASFVGLAAFFFVRRRRALVFFAAAYALWFVYAYGVFGASDLFHAIPGLSMAPINRSQAIGAFCLAALAAFTLHHALDPKRPRRVLIAIASCAAGLVLFWLARDRAREIVELTHRFMTTPDENKLLDIGSARHIKTIGVTFAAGIGLFALLWLAPAGKLRAMVAVALAGIVFLQSGWLLRGYMPVTDDAYFFPVTPAIRDLKSALHGRDVAILGDDMIPPTSNAVYGLRQISSYDALGIRRYDRLFLEEFGASNNWRVVRRGTAKALQLFGIDCVLDRDGWLEIDTALAFAVHNPRAIFPTGELLPDAEVVQTFTGIDDGLDSIRVRFVMPKHLISAYVELRLEMQNDDARTFTDVATERFESGDLDVTGEAALSAALRFAPIPGSRTKLFRLHVTSPGATHDDAFQLEMRQDWRTWIAQAMNRVTARVEGREPAANFVPPDAQRWLLTRGGPALDGQLYCDLGFAAHRFEGEQRIGPYTLHRFVDARSRFHTVGRAEFVADGDEAWSATLAPAFDPNVSVVVESASISARDASTPDTAPAPPVEVVAEWPGHFELRATRDREGWLVLSQPWYPGWKARVDGVEREIVRANYAFSAVQLDLGTHVIVLDYEPRSFRIALWLALVSAVSMTAWIVAAARISSLSRVA